MSLPRTRKHCAPWWVNATVLLDYAVLGALEMEKSGRTLSIFQMGNLWEFRLQIKHVTNTKSFILPALLCCREVVQKTGKTSRKPRAYLHHNAAPCYPHQSPHYFPPNPVVCTAQLSSLTQNSHSNVLPLSPDRAASNRPHLREAEEAFWHTAGPETKRIW